MTRYNLLQVLVCSMSLGCLICLAASRVWLDTGWWRILDLAALVLWVSLLVLTVRASRRRCSACGAWLRISEAYVTDENGQEAHLSCCLQEKR